MTTAIELKRRNADWMRDLPAGQAEAAAWDAFAARLAGDERLLEFNPYHDDFGRFTTADGNTTGSPLAARNAPADADFKRAAGSRARLAEEDALDRALVEDTKHRLSIDSDFAKKWHGDVYYLIDDAASAMKHSVCFGLHLATGIPYDEVSVMVASWAQTSNRSFEACALQEAAERLFGGKESESGFQAELLDQSLINRRGAFIKEEARKLLLKHVPEARALMDERKAAEAALDSARAARRRAGEIVRGLGGGITTAGLEVATGEIKRAWLTLRVQGKPSDDITPKAALEEFMRNGYFPAPDFERRWLENPPGYRDAMTKFAEAVFEEQHRDNVNTDLSSRSSGIDYRPDKILEEKRPDLMGKLETRLKRTVEKTFNDAVEKRMAFLSAMYDRTQHSDIPTDKDGYVTLYRGIEGSWTLDTVQRYRRSPAESWSLKPSIARSFAGRSGTVVKARFPKARLLSNWRTGLGCKDEREYVVVGRYAEDELYLVQGEKP